ncbi:phosphatidylserine decarboxylase family protein [Nitrospira moscoviensis]|uniref:Phosphatidylserine decarboxylase proenzyme n=1 Tax=Nitrospira moscoviensis TaxID=42253 RepID=A0A0K2G8J0_NITMO|nr:phosphatidylserine decarboxylase family protein [Nitrospira moscoviensis]ALA57291.1 Phosphatidylserine decarboxylase proenzyme [Nitrospira moscoviensis]
MADRAVGVPFAKEGFPFIGIAAGVTLSAAWVGWTALAAGAALLTLFVAWFFRNPARTVPQEPNLVVAPGDGKVIAIEEEFEPRFLKDRSIRLTIFLNVFDVHINRVPCEGTVQDVQYQPGLFLVASRPDATIKNEQNALMLTTPAGVNVLCVQVAGLIARRIVCWVKAGDRVQRGERYGLIRFGSRMDTFLPIGTALRVAVGDRVKGGETILGELR